MKTMNTGTSESADIAEMAPQSVAADGSANERREGLVPALPAA